MDISLPGSVTGDSKRLPRKQFWIMFGRFSAAGYLALMLIFFGVSNDSFFSVGTLTTIIQLSIPLFVVALGMTFCLLCGEVDLSVGGVAGLASTAAALAMSQGIAWPLAVGIALLIGLLIGMVNGALTAWLSLSISRFPSFLVTLATLALTGGIAEALEPLQQSVPINNNGFLHTFGYGSSILGSFTTWYAVCLIGVAYIVLTRSVLGYTIYAVGTNPVAAKFVGFRPNRTKFLVLTISGVLASAGGLLIAGFLQTGSATLAQGMDVDAITAAVIGGTSIFGGRGTIIGTVVGVLILGVMNTGLMLAQVATNWDLIIKGVLIVSAVAIGEYIRRRALIA